MSEQIDFSLNHFGIYVTDIDLMTDFYRGFFGFVVTDQRDGETAIRFLTRSAREHHQLLLAAGRPRDSASTVNQISFLVEDLAALRKVHARAAGDPRARWIGARDHGNSWAVYFMDPEGNMIECYAHTPWHVPQPYGRPLDFALSDEEISSNTQREVRTVPGFMPAESFRALVADKLKGDNHETGKL